MGEKVLNVLTVVIAAGLVVTIGMSMARFAGVDPGGEARLVSNWRPVAAGGTLMGADAPVRVVVFSDFQCQYCAQAAREMRVLRDQSGGRVALAFRHMPLEDIHPHAVAAAMASECAAEQGRFEAFHDHLFENQQAIGATAWTDFARAAGVPDLPAFGRCVAEQRHRGRVAADLEMAKGLGVTGTPTFMVNGRLVAGSGKAVQIAQWAGEPAADATAPAR